jgi:hypothetical protein
MGSAPFLSCTVSSVLMPIADDRKIIGTDPITQTNT